MWVFSRFRRESLTLHLNTRVYLCDHRRYRCYRDAPCSTGAVVKFRHMDVPAVYGHLKYSSKRLIKM